MEGVNPMAGTIVSLAPREPALPHLSVQPPKPGVHGAKALTGSEVGKLKEAAEQFEAIFVRQLLKGAKVTGKMGESGYGGMALEALAKGVTQSGGLGLAKAIENSIRHSHLSSVLPKKVSSP